MTVFVMSMNYYVCDRNNIIQLNKFFKELVLDDISERLPLTEESSLRSTKKTSAQVPCHILLRVRHFPEDDPGLC